MIVTTGLVGWDKEPGLVNGQKEISKKKRRGKTMGDSITGSLSVGLSKKSLDEVKKKLEELGLSLKQGDE